ncbi:hypothetical protein BSP239C_03186 [Brevibacterium sp. 239c]|uniref:hypothetical protein n=1 Tax=Brevibacterium sp. 239c TaxID=1965356 RepID=UPI000C64EC4B|nr:hypothetical protein [Brevibacterium sp. 239c]SMY01136.1 hypothetical protein BSP239C_03186 [Brevibacterium sp. 239c]
MDYEAEYNKLKDQFESLKSDSRKWEDRSKSNYDDLQKAQADLAERDKAIEAANTRLSEFEAANSDMKTKLDAIDTEKAHAELVAEVAKRTEVDAAALRGTTKEELEAHAETLKAVFAPSAPVIEGQANTPGEQPVDELREFTRGLFSTED